MADPFVAEIRIFGFNFAPVGWAFCNGQLLPLSQNTALFSLLGTTYGGNGKSNFALPDMQSNAPMHPGQGPGLSLHDLGEMSGSDSVTLLDSEMPSHTHLVQCKGTPPPANAGTPDPSVTLARSSGTTAYTAPANLGLMDAQLIAPNGGSLPHNNLMPYLVMNFCIALQGVFPPRS
jgi:microcystin-dependent protein